MQHVLSALAACDVRVAACEDQGKQIAIECPPAQTHAVYNDIKDLKGAARKLRRDADARIKALRRALDERSEFEQQLSTATAWLRAKHASLRSDQELPLDVARLKQDLSSVQQVKDALDTQVHL